MSGQQDKNGYIKWQVFWGFVSIAILALASVANTAAIANDTAQDNRVEIRGIQSEITSEFNNIKQSLDRIEKSVK